MARITFYGAAGTVTGSKYLVEAGKAKVLVDCGLFQGLKKLRELNWKKLPFDAATVNSVVLTHAHIDHIGFLPRFVRDGFRNKVVCTPATKELAKLLLLDSAKNQKRDADYLNRKKLSKHSPALPLYNAEDARRAIKRLKAVPRGEWRELLDPIWVRFHDAGHLLGSNMIEMEIRDRDPPLRILFSGDVGRYDAPLYFDPAPPPPCDYLICESTYGDRDHPQEDILDILAERVNKAFQRGGVMLFAAFAVGRSQQLIYLLQVLMHAGRIPRFPIFLDSPMAVDATKIFRTFSQDHDLSEGQLSPPSSVLDGPNVELVRDHERSKQLNRVTGPAVIISSSGMMTGGRILFHLKRRLPDPKNTVLLGGYMAAGTRGRDMQEGRSFVRIHGQDIPVRAAIDSVSGLSGHAGRSELLRWLKDLPKPKQTFITHGEPDSAASFAAALRDQYQFDTVIPQLGDSFELGE
ncbi:MBL fold metallo-hydrolase RNA specificity domain-containing protein [Blastopirellula marina]|uniref:Metallo-beta-lactamase family protein n=1 Tax=Blastopirellula marina DSM 3645 TaxID=314230 RepID=A3ZTP5_9BACT|nr:MBL fold metallo-hydrolase [Blastopirellula marina]EAQ80039.1 metallo-beta-lactamase family protein [Blastopirellula marina DSM 3645]